MNIFRNSQIKNIAFKVLKINYLIKKFEYKLYFLNSQFKICTI